MAHPLSKTCAHRGVATKLPAESKMAAGMFWRRVCSRFSSNLRQFEIRIINCMDFLQMQNNLALEIPYLPRPSPGIFEQGSFIDDGLVLMAVPKRKTTPSKKKMRNRHKWLKNRTDIHQCAVCGSYKLVGHLCGNCLEKVKEETKTYRKKNSQDEIHWPIPDVLKSLVR